LVRHEVQIKNMRKRYPDLTPRIPFKWCDQRKFSKDASWQSQTKPVSADKNLLKAAGKEGIKTCLSTVEMRQSLVR
jgi:hypothetical protein